jgi:ornithine carbamoyltransferase
LLDQPGIRPPLSEVHTVAITDTIHIGALRGRDLVSLRDLSRPELRMLLDRAREMKRDAHAFHRALDGRTLAMIFEKPSLRTRVSFDVGMNQLGGHALYLSPAEISMGKRESVHDVAHNLERMVDAILIRTFAHALVEELAAHARVPVINGLSDFDHPCQALADYLTMQEAFGTVEGRRIAFVGDGNNVANALIFGAARLGAHIVVATPQGYEPRPDVVEWARANGATGASCQVTGDPFEAVAGADVVYTDVWTSMGQEDEMDARRRIFAPYQVNEALFSKANPGAIFLHCLPAHRGEEVTAGVIDSPRSRVFDQAENRLHAQKALLYALLA